MRKTIGWDIGGAHVKAVMLDEQGMLKMARQVPCPLWLGLNQLSLATAAILKQFACSAKQANHAVTMTGELVDLFNNRQEGVVKIAQFVSEYLGEHVLFYKLNNATNDTLFVSVAQVAAHTRAIASANWHASARLVAKKRSPALLVDIGSTTTDIIPIVDGYVVNSGWNDAERLQEGTLVYTGIVRTPIMAIAQQLEVDGKQSNIAAEHFATTADIYRLTGELVEASDMAPTADGAAKTAQASARRLARMVGYDLADKPFEVWRVLAHTCRSKQLNQIIYAMQRHLLADMVVVGTGAGRFLVKDAAKALKQPYADLTEILGRSLSSDVDHCFPAYAVAQLAFESQRA